MSLVPAICPQCGGQFEIEKEKEASVCQYCGTPFIVEKAINNYTTTITNNNNFSGATINVSNGNVENLLKMATSAIEAKNGAEALDYANRVLEINPEQSAAWFIKMKSLEDSSTIAAPKVDEVISCGKNAIKYAKDSERSTVSKQVYLYYLERASALLVIALGKLRDTAQIKNLARLGIAGMQGAAQGDATYRTLFLNLAQVALKLKQEIPIEVISADKEIQKEIASLASLYGLLCEADVDRLKVYGQKLLDSAIEARKATLKKFMDGLPEDQKSSIAEEKVSTNSGGCYIATCVYGSYDCPQVWILRRYRDNTLLKTWYGKLFVHTYYAVSPTVVKLLGNKKAFHIFWKRKLDRITNKLYNYIITVLH